MATRDFSQYTLYRWRYVIGYSAIGLILAALLVFAGLYLPGGLSDSEIRSVERSTSLALSDPASLALPNLPYYFLQAGIFAVFGVSIFTIKLPSLILALLSAAGLVLLLQRWFRPNIVVLTSLIAVTTGQFLYIAQSGTPSILYVFWPVTILLLGTLITRAKRLRFLWKICFAVAAALSLYTPLGIYPIIAILLAVVFHPHLRAIVRRLSVVKLSVMGVVFAILVAPLFWLMTINPQLSLTLIGIPREWPPDLLANIQTVLMQYFYFWEPSTSEVMTPFFGLGSALLILLGLYRLIRTRDTTRSYLIIFWILLLTPVLVLNPVFTSITFVPSVFMLAAGLMSLISYWYRLFPLNPYARVAGLIPIIVLVTALISTGLVRYVYGYHYNPAVVPLFSKDLKLLPENTGQLVVAEDERLFYEGIAKYDDTLSVVTAPSADEITTTREAHSSLEGYDIERIIVNERSADADRFYVMRRSE